MQCVSMCVTKRLISQTHQSVLQWSSQWSVQLTWSLRGPWESRGQGEGYAVQLHWLWMSRAHLAQYRSTHAHQIRLVLRLIYGTLPTGFLATTNLQWCRCLQLVPPQDTANMNDQEEGRNYALETLANSQITYSPNKNLPTISLVRFCYLACSVSCCSLISPLIFI